MGNDRQLDYHDMRPDNFAAHLETLRANRQPIALLLDGVTDQRNIGAIFRLCDAANLEHLYLWGLSEFKVDKKIRRVSRQTTEYVDHTVLSDESALHDLLQNYERIIALDHTERSIDYRDVPNNQRTLLVVGNEQRGCSQIMLQRASLHMHLPMLGVKTSMNVACAATVAVYALLPE